MDTKRIEVYTVLILSVCTGWIHGQSATMDVSYSPNPAVIGPNPLVVRSVYSFTASEPFRTLAIQDTAAEQYAQVLATDNGTIGWSTSTPQYLKDRATVLSNLALKRLEIQFTDTKCSDIGLNFVFKLNVGNSIINRDVTKTVTVNAVEAPPKAPAMTVVPDSQNVTEFTEMTFTCEGNVGRPAGTIQWFTFNENENTPMSNVTDKAQAATPEDDVGDLSCTKKLRSVLRLNVTRLNSRKRLVVRCRVNHPTQGNSNIYACQDPNTDFCQMSQQIDVQYPVSVNVKPGVSITEGFGDNITCTTDGNPTASRIEWHKEGDNTTLSTDNILRLTNVSFDSAGDYTCTAYNIIEGTIHQASATVTVAIMETTPPSPSTSTSKTTPSGNGGGQTIPDTAGGGDNLEIIIPVVVVGVLLIIIIAVVVFLWRRNRAKKIDEPKEKAFNNHAGINPMATRPDLVNNDKAFSGYDNSGIQKNEDGLAYAELQFDNKPRSRRPLAIDDSCTNYSDVSMPQV